MVLMPMTAQTATERVSDREFMHAVARAARRTTSEEMPGFWTIDAGARPPMIQLQPGEMLGAAALRVIDECGGRPVGVSARVDGTIVHFEWKER